MVLVRQVLEEDRVDDAKHRGVYAQTQGEGKMAIKVNPGDLRKERRVKRRSESMLLLSPDNAAKSFKFFGN